MPTSPRAIYVLKSADGKDIMHQCTDSLYKLMVKFAVKTSKIYKNSYSLFTLRVCDCKTPNKTPNCKDMKPCTIPYGAQEDKCGVNGSCKPLEFWGSEFGKLCKKIIGMEGNQDIMPRPDYNGCCFCNLK